MLKFLQILLIAQLLSLCTCKVYYEERFNTDEALTRWIQSKSKDDLGKFIITKGKTETDAEEDNGLKTSEDAKFYGLSTNFDKFTNKGKTLVLQFTVKHEQGIDCGGGYVKVFDSTVTPESFHGETPYHIMFGPDICGISTKKVHVIFSHDSKNHLVKKDIRCKDDELTHMYRLILKPTNKFEVQIDDETVDSGSLEEDFDILPPKMIDDESVKKPVDWVEDEMMPDPTDTKPEEWDQPKTIPNVDAKKPDDWDDEMDGEWEAPQVDNPDHKGTWSPKSIKNPAYKGDWVQPQIDNPDFKEDKELYSYGDIGGIGFDLWQVKSGTIFDNLAICDDVEECKSLTKDIWKSRQEAEQKLKDEDSKKMQEEMAKQQESSKTPDEDNEAKEDIEEEKPHDEL